MQHLQWPEENASPETACTPWFEQGSNICLDFHGDPASADLAVFSDGNHHMALRDCLEYFQQQHPELSGIFYATTPPGPIVKMFRAGCLKLGNLVLRTRPHVFISPLEVVKSLARDGLIQVYYPFVKNQGNVLLVRKGNPRNIAGVDDLDQKGVRLFLSSPYTEKTSYSAYFGTLKNLAAKPDLPDELISSGRVVFGKCIHHREAPRAVADGRADAAVVFYHLGLRYIRIFPDIFEMVPLGGTVEKPDPLPGNIISGTCIGLAKDEGRWGRSLMDFLRWEKAGQIYTDHGLLPLNDCS